MSDNPNKLIELSDDEKALISGEKIYLSVYRQRGSSGQPRHMKRLEPACKY